jgi:hypothetical protein
MKRLSSPMTVVKPLREHILLACCHYHQRYGDLADIRSLGETICGHVAPTRVESERSARNGWRLTGLRSRATEPAVVSVRVDEHRPDTYPASRHPRRLKQGYRRKLEAMRPKLPPSGPPTDDRQSEDHGECTTMVRYRPDHPKVGSPYHPRHESGESAIRRPSHYRKSSTCRPATDLSTSWTLPPDDLRSKRHHELRPPSTSQYDPSGRRIAEPKLWSSSDHHTSSGFRNPVDPHVQAAPSDNLVFPTRIADDSVKSWDDRPDRFKFEPGPNAPSTPWGMPLTTEGRKEKPRSLRSQTLLISLRR